MTRKLHLSQTEIRFIEDAADLLTEIPRVTHQCPHCGRHVIYPLVVSNGDAEMMQRLLRIADTYLQESGASAAMMADVLGRCLIAKARQKGKR